MLEPISWAALAVIFAALAAAITRRFLAVGSLVIANLAIFAMTALGPRMLSPTQPGVVRPVIHEQLGLHADQLVAGEPMAFLNLLTSMFVHADFFHFLVNMIILLAFALPFEERIGARKFLAVYVLSGLVGAGVQVAFVAGAPILMMGASAAVFGVIGAFATAFPRQVIAIPLPLPIMILVRMRVVTGALIFGALQIVMITFAGANSNTAFEAHLGGLGAGLLLGLAVRGPTGQAANKTVEVDFSALDAFAADEGTKHALEELQRNRDLPDLWAAWMERFFRTAECPQCHATVMPERTGHVVCSHGHRFDIRMGHKLTPPRAGHV